MYQKLLESLEMHERVGKILAEITQQFSGESHLALQEQIKEYEKIFVEGGIPIPTHDPLEPQEPMRM